MKKLFFIFLIAMSIPCFARPSELENVKLQQQATQIRLDDLEKKLDLTFTMRDKELVNAAESVDKRLQNMNEFRSQLKDQAATFLTRQEYLVAHTDIVKNLEEIKLYQANQEGRLWMLGAGLTAFMTAFQGLGFYLIKKHGHSP